MAMQPGASKRQKELHRAEKKASKDAERKQRKQEKDSRPKRGPGEEDPDIAGIIPGPQPKEDVL
jgi:hypothetical protein